MLNRTPYVRQRGLNKEEEAPAEEKVENIRAFNLTTEFCSYLTKKYADELLSQGVLEEGVLHVFPSDYHRGYVQTATGEIVVPNRKMLNRAFDGDLVYIHIIDEKMRSEDLQAWDIHSGETAEQTVNLLVSKPVGHIVYAEERLPRRIECILNENEIEVGKAQFEPINRQYPRVDVVRLVSAEIRRDVAYTVEIREWMPQMKHPAGVLVDVTRTLKMDTLDSICDFVMQEGGVPLSYGKNTELPEETTRALMTSEKELCEDLDLPRELVFETSEKVLLNIEDLITKLHSRSEVFKQEGRTDLTEELVFTIDPDTAKDFDDACHIRIILEDDSTMSFKQFAVMSEQMRKKVLSLCKGYEIGVHIADVTHYVSAGSNLDVQAQQTTTSVYLTDRCCPMYPFELADGLCSLNPAVPRYCFSCIFRIDKEGYLLPQTVWFGKTIVLSHCRLDYVAAEEIIDKTLHADNKLVLFKEKWPVALGYQQAVVLAVQCMNSISVMLRKQRNEMGALQLNSAELRWRVSSDLHVSVLPPEAASEAHHLIEEFMVAANCMVAMRLVESFPGVEILRSHPPPRSDVSFNKVLEKRGYVEMNTENGVALCKSLGVLAKELQKRLVFDETLWPAVYQAEELANMCFICNNLLRASYVVGLSATEQFFNHWGIHAQLYMHFTSPIRRYADCICHRMLEAALRAEADFAEAEKPLSNPITPHKLVIRQKTPIYSADVLPPHAFLRACDEFSPMHGDHEKNAEKATHMADGEILSEIEAGKQVSLSGAKLKGKLQKSIDYLLQYGTHIGQETAILAPKAQTSEEEQELIEIRENLEKYAGMSPESVKEITTTCNQRAIEASDIEDQHHLSMLAIMLEKQGGQIKSTGFIVAAKEEQGTIVLYVPAFDAVFGCSNDCKNAPNACICIQNYNKDLAFNEETNDEMETFIELPIMEPIDVRLVAVTEVGGSIELWLDIVPQVGNKETK